MGARSGDGLSIPGNLGIFTPLRQHTQCGEIILKKVNFGKSKKGKSTRENPRANDLAWRKVPVWASALVYEGCTTLGACLLGKVEHTGIA
jgi:hypothetical protein